ncbi:hypothetical protein V8D89_011843 [Ganoderma adspersum]
MSPRQRARANHAQKGGSVAQTVHVVKLRRGCLKEIPNFAVEIQLMIFSNLRPQDLLNLSRTSKIFHGFFLHRSNEALWEAALKNAEDLPERPPWMSVPAFIHLLYSPHCHNCGCPNIRKVIWRWFARYCSSCLEKVTYRAPEVYALFRNAPCTVDELIGQWSALPRPMNSGAANALGEQRLRDYKIEIEYATSCEKWYNQLEKLRNDGRQNGRTERFDAIIKKLKETGWEKDLLFLGERGVNQMSRLPVVRQSTKLTEKRWEKVQTALHTFLGETRSAWLKKERETVIRMRFAQLNQAIIAHCVTIPRDATTDCRPVAFDLALQAELEPIANAPSSENITQETFAAIVPPLVVSWKAEQCQFLRSFLGRFITKVPRGVDILDLAISVVYTHRASDVWRMRYPFILSENLNFRYFKDDPGEFPSSHYAAPVASSLHHQPYTLKHLEPKQVEVGIKWMRSIVAKLGLKPDTATLSDLEQCDARLRCLKCAEEGEGEEWAYTWETAFWHTAEHDAAQSDKAYPRSSHNRWGRVDEAAMVKVKEREAITHALTVDSDCQWSCALCLNWKGQGGADANNAVEDETIFWSPRYNGFKKPAVKL